MWTIFKHHPRKMLMSFDIKKKGEMGDQLKAIDGPDTISLTHCIIDISNKTENSYNYTRE